MATMASNSTNNALPPLPLYSLEPQPSLLGWLPDAYLTLILPILAYWGFSMLFHMIDELDLFPQYRLHTPAEVLKRNHVSRWEVVRDVVIQQVVQTIVGIAISWTEPDQLDGKNDFNVAVWAQRLRLSQRGVPSALAAVGLDSQGIAKNVVAEHPIVAAVLSGGKYPWLTSMTHQGPVAAFAGWEMSTAKAIYWFLIPAAQFVAAIIIVDTWQYFLHRAMHMNKYLYSTVALFSFLFIESLTDFLSTATFHSRHHRLYVPYAYGALYNHPFEGFLLDTLGTGMAYMITGMTPRQSMWFFTGSTIKTVDDHCGYALPWDPLQHLTSNNAGYHDVHHQSWGIKTNFSQPFFTFWDRLLGTVWTGGDVSLRYERARLAAERKVAAAGKDGATAAAAVTASRPIDSVLDAGKKAPYNTSSDPDATFANVQNSNPTTTSSNNSNKTRPTPPPGKATTQAISSRAQVLSDPSPAGGPTVLAEETAEEDAEKERACFNVGLASPSSAVAKRSRKTSGSGSGGGLKGLLRERVSGMR
ncbi:MAG: hypothetical protein M1828_005093 [Chrysothrix sp. TS-e1954]|nr:MAG: hypothetical protein M1828_005093 [Chrysothrix sp. TS-e1954]